MVSETVSRASGRFVRHRFSWVHVHCTGRGCGHSVVLALAPFQIRWGVLSGPRVADLLRKRLRCSHCGQKGVTLTVPSFDVRIDDWQRYPVEQGLLVLPHGAVFESVCNLYRMRRSHEEVSRFLRGTRDLSSNQQLPESVYPNYEAPVIRRGDDGPAIQAARWGLPSPAFALKGRKADAGVTNVRNLSSPHWKRWLGVENRCIVPFTSFAENDQDSHSPVWFALDETEPLAFFAGILVRQWKSVRKVKDGETTDDLFAFLTTRPNAEVAAVHPKAMPVILTTPIQCEAWLTIPSEQTVGMQSPLKDGALVVVGRGKDVTG